MRLSSLADYAVVMMTAAARAGCGSALTATALATRTAVPLATAQKLMQRLAKAGLLTSARGTGGGFRLARPAAAINLADIIEAIEGPIAMTTCVDERVGTGERHNCALDHHCVVKPHWGPVNAAVRGALASVSLSSLIRHPGEGRGPRHETMLPAMDPGLRSSTEVYPERLPSRQSKGRGDDVLLETIAS